MRHISPEQADHALQQQAEKIKGKDLEKVLSKQDRIEAKFQKNENISAYFEHARSMFGLIRDYWSGTYTGVPWKTIAAAAGGLLYVLVPLDLLPDFIPLVGLIDDAGVIAACVSLVRQDLLAYEKWKVLEEQEQGVDQ